MSLEIAQLAADNREKVCGIDLAGDEFQFPGRLHVDAFELAESGLTKEAKEEKRLQKLAKDQGISVEDARQEDALHKLQDVYFVRAEKLFRRKKV